MADWRDRNAVPDSEDEEENLSFDASSNDEHEAIRYNEDGYSFKVVGEFSGKKKETKPKIAVVIATARKERTGDDGSPESVARLANKISVKAVDAVSRSFEEDDDEIDELQQDHVAKATSSTINNELYSHESGQGVGSGVQHPEEQHVIQSCTSSPLSSAHSSDVEMADFANISTETRHDLNEQQSTTIPSQQVGFERLSSVGLSVEKSLDATIPAYSLPRLLRPRNPIHLHPYAIESEKYKQTLKGRGLQPLRIAQQETQDDGSEASGGEEQDSYVSPNRRNRLIQRESPTLSSSPPQTLVQDLGPLGGMQGTSSNVDEEEFPDLSTMLRRPTSQGVRHGFKRVKTSHTYSKQNGRPQREHTLNLSSASPHHSAHSRGRRHNVFDIPPSPPTSAIRPSSSDATAPHKNHFRMPPGLITPQIQTPVASSETRYPQIQLGNDDSTHAYSSDSEPIRVSDRRQRRVTLDDELNLLGELASESEPEVHSVESSEPSEKETEQLHRVQRKIRGVLPASWLRLDMKNGAKKARDQLARRELEPLESPKRDRNHRGVARPVSRPLDKDHLSTRSSTILISDGSSPERGGRTQTRQHPPRDRLDDKLSATSREVQNLVDWPDSESMEDDHIDHMLQPASRAITKTKKPKSRQTALSFMGKSPRMRKESILRRNQITSERGKRASFQPLTKSSVQSRTARRSQCRLGILDISRAQTKGNNPAFINIAARSARSRRDLGRHSPSKKFLRLATREDTADIQETLVAWESGLLAQERRSAMPLDARMPLDAASGNRRPSGYPRGRHRQSKTVQDTRSETGSDVKSLTSKTGNHIGNIIQSILDRQRNQGSKKTSTKVDVIKSLQSVSTGRPRYAHITSSLHARGSARPALLEISATNRTHAPIGLNSYKTPRLLITTIANPMSNPILDRFLQDGTLEDPTRSIRGVDCDASHTLGHETLAKSPTRKARSGHRRQKQKPKQLDIRKPFFHKAIEIDDDFDGVEVATFTENGSSSYATLSGLGPYGTEYSLDFGIEQQLLGSHFWKPLIDRDTKSKKALEDLKHRDLGKAVEDVSLCCFGMSWKWGAWTESVSSELSETAKEITSLIHQQPSEVNLKSQQDFTEILNALESISLFYTKNLYFLDPIDRVSCIKHTLTLITTIHEALHEKGHILPHDNTELATQSRKHLRSASIKIVSFAIQIHVLSAHELVSVHVRESTKVVLEKAFWQSMVFTFSYGLKEAWVYIRHSQDLNMHVYDEDGQAACISALLHAAVHLHLEHSFQERLCKFFFESCVTHLRDVRVLESIWRDVFTIVPFFRRVFSTEAQMCRLGYNVQLWVMIKRLVEPVLQSYTLEPRGQASTFNSYLRTVIGRCLKLVQQWNWQRPEAIIGTFFDFFARNNLGNLEHERSHGSPQFLQQLSENTELDLLPQDPSFHTFLKLLGAGLRSMRNDYPSKKIRDIAWRYMPNHGRNLPKDQCIRQEDLDALRNHHDLLCVLYWASPSEFRPRVTAIQNLVQIETSHREACHINIRAWSNLVRYQLSTDEPLAKLEPFEKWISEILSQVLHLHSLARSEVESQAKTVELSGLGTISPDDQESMISRNQRQVEAVLEDSIIQLRAAIQAAQTGEIAQTLFPDSLSNVLEMFDSKRPRTNSVVIQALRVYSALAQKYASEQGEPESQNYGDWPSFEDEHPGPSSTFFENLLSAVHRLLSNIFGADNLLDESLLTQVVDAWTAVIHLAVLQGTKSWNDVLGPYGSHSWNSLRDTEQTRKYTPYAFAFLIKKDKQVYKEHEESIYKAWLASCLDRDSTLKFQHLLTAEALELRNTNPLFNNVQATIKRRYHQCANSINEFRSSRDGLLSAILATMRENLDYRNYHELGDRGKLKQDFTDLLKHMMNTMKSNYQVLGNSNVKGAYVDFVHMVVGLLQQHTADVCPIDRFFIDSPDFPAPATDPAYVVDRILSYVHRFKDGKSLKQLTSLIQNLCERAIVDDKVEELADQFELALHLNGRDDFATKERLLDFMVHTILPVYIDVAFTTRCGWLLAEPLLLAMRGTFESLVSWIDISSKENVDYICSTIFEVLEPIHRSMIHWIDDHQDSADQNALPSHAPGTALQLVTTLLPLLDYLYRNWPMSNRAQDARNTFIKIKLAIRYFKRTYYQDSDNKNRPDPKPFADVDVTRPQYDYVPAFALRELKSALSERWQERSHENGDVYFRSNSRGEWVKVADGYSRDTDTLLDNLHEFDVVHAGLQGLHEDGNRDDEHFRRVAEPDQAWDWRDEAPPF